MDLKSEGKKKKRNVDAISLHKEENWEEEEAATSSLPTKRSKKEMTRKPNLGSFVNCGLHEEEEKPNVGEGMKKEEVLDFDAKSGNASDIDKNQKKKKRKRDEIEKEYEEKKFGAVREEGEEKKKNHVGEKRKKLDDSTELMVSKEGFDDENKLLRTVFVRNLPLKVKKKTILKEFNNFGEVESVRIRSVPVIDAKKTTRKGALLQKQINERASSVLAYVVFKSEQSVEASLADNMTLIGGNHIRVDRACPPRKKLKGESAPFYDPRRTVFVGNLPFDVTDEELYQLFTSISDMESSVEGIRVVRDPQSNVGKGIAYVLFKTREVANLVIRKGSLKLRDRELRLSPTKCDSTPTKRKNPFCASNLNSPAKKLATGKINSSGAEEERTPLQAYVSYQGIRATKSVSNKKRVHQKSPGSAKANPEESGRKEAGNKRKLDNMSPGTFCQNKKLKQY